MEDDSLEHFLAVRLGPELARTLGSALVHGIYAADSRELSVRAAFPSLWEAANRGNGSFVRGMLSSPSSAATSDNAYDLGSVHDLMQGASVYSFRNGMLTLVEAMVSALEKCSNAKLVPGDAAVALGKDEAGGHITVRDTRNLPHTRTNLNRLCCTGPY